MAGGVKEGDRITAEAYSAVVAKRAREDAAKFKPAVERLWRRLGLTGDAQRYCAQK